MGVMASSSGLLQNHVEIRETSAGGDSTPIFRADKPFLYVIKENSTGAFLFMGKVGMPVYEE
jgi:serine protease inhibitor